MVDLIVDIFTAVGLSLLAATCFFAIVLLCVLFRDWWKGATIIGTCVCHQPDCGGGCGGVQSDSEMERLMRKLNEVE